MRLHRFLRHLDERLVPDLPALVTNLRGWLERLRDELRDARDGITPATSQSTHTAVLLRLEKLFADRPEDVKKYLDEFERGERSTDRREPGSLASVGDVDTSALPSNETYAAELTLLIDALDEHLGPPSRPAPRPPAPTPPGSSS